VNHHNHQVWPHCSCCRHLLLQECLVKAAARQTDSKHTSYGWLQNKLELVYRFEGPQCSCCRHLLLQEVVLEAAADKTESSQTDNPWLFVE
jgi:hypothetical protein